MASCYSTHAAKGGRSDGATATRKASTIGLSAARRPQVLLSCGSGVPQQQVVQPVQPFTPLQSFPRHARSVDAA